MNQHLLYVGGTLPARSETFVYREIFALRSRGWQVETASVHPPECDLGDEALDQLSRDAVPIYGSGWRRLLADAFLEAAAHPSRTIQTLRFVFRAMLLPDEVPQGRRIKSIWQTLAGLALARRVRSRRIVHVHAHMAHVPATIGMVAASHLNVSFSFTGHAVDLFREQCLLRTKLQAAAFVPCISRWHREYFRGLVPRPDCEMPVIRCGVEIDATDVKPQCESESVPAILAVGRLVPKKGFDLLLEAAAALHAMKRQFRIAIVGDGPERERLQTLCTTRSLGSVVTFLGARCNREVQDLMREADVFVLPCRIDSDGDRDGIPVVLMEAMAHGLPVISGDLPAIRELVTSQLSGLLVPCESIADLAQAIDTLLKDSSMRRRLGAAGKQAVQSEFSLPANIDRLEAALRSALARPPCEEVSRPTVIGVPTREAA